MQTKCKLDCLEVRELLRIFAHRLNEVKMEVKKEVNEHSHEEVNELKLKYIRVSVVLVIAILVLIGCSQVKERPQYLMEGVWTLQYRVYPGGGRAELSENEEAHGLIYDGDSMAYVCRLIRTPSGLVMTPIERGSVTVVNKGGGEILYLEGNNPRPLTMIDDTTMTIQRHGVKYGYHRAEDIWQEWGDDMRDIVAGDTATVVKEPTNYVFSVKERQQENTIHWLIYTMIVILLLVAHYVITNQRSKRRLKAQLQQIREEHEERPQSVRQAMEAEEERFFASDEYGALVKRMAEGQPLKMEEWTNVEQLLKTVYPGFTTQLRNLYPMSELEYQVCLLVKLRIIPTDIASVLSRDGSTISTVRSRLYKKVFGSKGGARDWDEFVLSIGA